MDTALRIELPQDMVALLEERGKPEREVARLVKMYWTRTDLKPLLIGDTERREIEQILGRNVTTSADIIKGVKRLTTITVGEIEISLNERQMSRFRTLLPHKTGDEFRDGVKKIITNAIQNMIRVK